MNACQLEPGRGSHHGQALAGALIGAALLLAPPSLIQAQETGTITGRVSEAGTFRALASVQVYLVGTGIGALSREDGRYIIINVPAGVYEFRAERIGYGTETREITVRAGETSEVDVQLGLQALGLDEIVVTGTAGAARRREVGNSIAELNLSQVNAPPVSMDNLLQGQMAGVNVLPTTGSVAGGAQIRLRGNVSVAMSNQPLIYVDGVRIRSDGYPDNDPLFGRSNRGANYNSSPLNDINPNDIERIEVIRGAAATTLYGTEAAAGVIQIFTKRGQRGSRATWTAQIDQGFDHLLAFGPSEPGPNGEDASHMFMDPWLRNGHRQTYNLSVSGGLEDVQYFISGSYKNNQGVLPLDEEEGFTVRGNLTAIPLTDLQLQWNTSYTSTEVVQTPTGNNLGLTLNVYRRDRNYVASEKKEDIDPFLDDWELRQQMDHFVTGVTVTHNVGSAFTQRLTAGYDFSVFEGRNYRGFGQISFPLGTAQDKRWESTVFTLDYVGTLDFNLTQELRSSFSVGGQAVTSEETWSAGGANEWPGPGDHVVSNGAQTFGFEGRQRVINAGFFFQNLFDLSDRYFLTVGLRVDGNSAFGEDLGLQAYPKVSLSYVVSDEPFWPESIGRLKLRAAWGQAGRAPGAFDAVRTWQALGWGGPAYRPNQLGNPELGPERTTETEVGFEGSLLDERLSLDFTYYYQKTTDALFEVTHPPSTGFQDPQLENVGEMQNKGLELSANFSAIQRRNFAWDVGGAISTNHSKVLTLGGAPEFDLGNQGWIVEGQPVPVIRGRCVLNPDEIADPEYPDGLDCFYGPNLPTTTLSLNTRFELPWGLSLSARGEYQEGGYMYDGASFNALRRNVKWPFCFDVYKKQGGVEYDKSNEGMLTALERARCNPARVTADVLVYPTDFFKVRELSLRAPIPQSWIPGTASASLTLSAQNFWKWVNDDFPVFDPEMINNEGMDAQVRSMLEHVPPAATYLATLRVTF